MRSSIVAATVALLPQRCCRFAERYLSANFEDPSVQAAFVTEAVASERAFYAKPFVGYDGDTGWTYDGININPISGQVDSAVESPRTFTAASKEALHLSLLVLSVRGIRDNGDMPYPYTDKEAWDLFDMKATAYETFNKQYPEYKGWLPWLCSRGMTDDKCHSLKEPATGAAPAPGDTFREIPGYDNGEFAWAMYTTARVLAAKAVHAPEYGPLAARYGALLDQLRESAVDVWFHNGEVCGRVVAENTGLFTCKGDDRLADPYEGELLLIFIDLLGDWRQLDHGSASDALWAAKQSNIVKRTLYGVNLQAGWHFSAHEQWKLLMLPYMDLPKTAEIMRAGEVARSRYSLIEGIPGLLGDANEPTPDSPNGPVRPGCPTGYCKSVGVEPLAQAPVEVNWTITPYAAFPMVITDRPQGFAWYNAMLRAPRMQTSYGAGESVSADGEEVSRALTWDTKALILVSIYGGMGPIVKPYMVQDGIFYQFSNRVETMYQTIFGPVTGGQPKPGLPHMVLESDHRPFPSCACTALRSTIVGILPFIGLYIAVWGGQFTAVGRVIMGGIAGAIPGAKLNFVYAMFMCDAHATVGSLETCRAFNDPVASSVLLALFGSMLCVRSLRVSLVVLLVSVGMTALVLVALALPGDIRSFLVRPQVIMALIGLSIILAIVLGISPVYYSRSRLLTGSLASLLGAGMLVTAAWGYVEVDIFDPVWTGAPEGWPLPLFAWIASSLVFLWIQFWRRGAQVRHLDLAEQSNAWDNEGMKEYKFSRSGSLPDVPAIAGSTSAMAAAPLLGDPISPARNGSLGMAGADGQPRGIGLKRSANSLASMAGMDTEASVPDLQKLEREALMEMRQVQESRLDPMPEVVVPSTPPEDYLNRPATTEGLMAAHSDGWMAKFYLWASVLISLACTASVPFTVDWSDTNLVIGLIFCILQWFLLWNVTDLFISTIAYHAVRIIWGFQEVPRHDLLDGLPDSARTLIMFCLLSDNLTTSKETWDNAYKCYLDNLDPNGNMGVSLVSVSNKLSVVQYEVEYCAYLQEEFYKSMHDELEVFIAYARTLDQWPPEQRERAPQNVQSPVKLTSGVISRYYFWTGLAQRLYRTKGVQLKAAKDAMRVELESMGKNILYLHRNSRCLKKPGQYQDAIILCSTGDNKAYTYTDPMYGKLGREPDSSCFGFTGNLVNDDPNVADFQKIIRALQKKGEVHVQRLKRSGQTNPYRYSMVMDSDTVSEWRSVLRLVEYGVANPSHGIFQCALCLDDEAEAQTWYMWAESLRQASNVNLPKAHWTIFSRHGFYGKGLFDNNMMIGSVIGSRPPKEKAGHYKALEALPIDIMSHDTFEAKILKPCFIPDVRLREEPAKNALSSFPQTTRWMVGEVRNASYPPGLFRIGIMVSQKFYGMFSSAAPKLPPLRQHDIPVQWGTDYIAHISFRVMHAGPAIMMIILMRNYSAAFPGALHFRNQFLSIPLTIFTIFSLFILPKGLLVLDMIPSIGLGRRRERGLIYGASADAPEYPPPPVMSGLEVFFKKLFLSMIEAILSALIFGPECLIGFQRAFMAYSAQITGKVAWRPQAAVDAEVESNTGPHCSMGARFCYVLQSVWHIPALGALIAVTTMMFGICEPFSIVLWVSWMLHPIITTAGCCPLPSAEENYLVDMVRKIKEHDACHAHQ
jgi:hypothetical protein